MTPAANAADRILVEKEALARAMTEALYRDRPQLTERYGEVGRRRCLEDLRYNLEHLAPAVELEDPTMFARYVRWLDDLLTARNVGTEDVIRSLELMIDEFRARFPADEAAAVETCIRAGLEELSPREASA